MLGLFLNKLTPEYMYYRRNMQNFRVSCNKVKRSYLKKEKAFSNFLDRFSNVSQV